MLTTTMPPTCLRTFVKWAGLLLQGVHAVAKPKHGEPGHECPMDQVFEWRPTGAELTLYLKALETLEARIAEAAIIALLEGRTERVGALSELGLEILAAQQRIEDFLTKVIAEDQAEDRLREEFNV